MKKIIYISLILFCHQAFSQDAKTKAEYIYMYCDSINAQIADEGEYRNYYLIHSVQLESNRRAIGKQYTNINFFYRQFQDTVIETENSMKFIDIKEPPIKVTVDYNIAASVRMYYEYYFNLSGELIYYHSLSATGVCDEEHCCFEKQKPILYKTNSLINCDKTTNPIPDTIQVKDTYFEEINITEKASNFSKEELDKIQTMLNHSKQYLKMFDDLLIIEKTDK